MACNIIIAPATPVGTIVPHNLIDLSNPATQVETITATGTSQQTTIVANPNSGTRWYVSIFAEGASVWIKTGTNPTATVGGTSVQIGQDQIRDFLISAGDKVAVIAA